MKKILLYGTLVCVFFLSFLEFTSASIWGQSRPQVIYCQWNDCSLERGIEYVKDDLTGIEKNQKASVFIQNIVVYLLTFITIIAVLYIIYAGFRILIWAGDEEQQTNAKKIIISVVLGIALMWLSFAIVWFIMDVLNAWSTTPPTNP